MTSSSLSSDVESSIQTVSGSARDVELEESTVLFFMLVLGAAFFEADDVDFVLPIFAFVFVTFAFSFSVSAAIFSTDFGLGKLTKNWRCPFSIEFAFSARRT